MILQENQSKSSSNIYHIIQGKDGVVYCDCWQWKINRTCKHLQEYVSDGSVIDRKTKITNNSTNGTKTCSQIIADMLKGE